jgi:hypothetical protein
VTREPFYVAMTRGRQVNAAYVVTTASDPDSEEHVAPSVEAPTAREVLLGVLATDGGQFSATEQMQQRFVDAGLPGLVRHPAHPGQLRRGADTDPTATAAFGVQR